MKKKLLPLLASCLILVSGCSLLLPKKVELFQDKVRAVPEQKASEKETQRQAAKMAALKANETLIAAVAEDSSAWVIAPAAATVALTEAVSTSVGPPANQSTLRPEDLARKLDTAVAKLNARLDDFKKENNENTGKKIEGTGVFQFGYFSMWAVIIGGIALLGIGLKIYGMINPVVGLGVNTVGRVSSAVLRKGVSELTEGGEWFKEYVLEHTQNSMTKEEILELFKRSQVEAQSRDVQKLVEKLTSK